MQSTAGCQLEELERFTCRSRKMHDNARRKQQQTVSLNNLLPDAACMRVCVRVCAWLQDRGQRGVILVVCVYAVQLPGLK